MTDILLLTIVVKISMLIFIHRKSSLMILKYTGPANETVMASKDGKTEIKYGSLNCMQNVYGSLAHLATHICSFQ